MFLNCKQYYIFVVNIISWWNLFECNIFFRMNEALRLEQKAIYIELVREGIISNILYLYLIVKYHL